MSGAKLFLNGFGLSLSAGAVILVLLLIRSGLARRYSARWRCVIWLLLAVRLLIPLPLESGIFQIELPQRLSQPKYGQSDTYSFPQRSAVPNLEAAGQQEEGAADQVSVLPELEVNFQEPETTAVLLKKAGPSPLSIACGVWLGGGLLCAAGQLLRYSIWRRRTLRWNQPVQDKSLLKMIKEESSAAKLPQPPRAYYNATLSAPLVLGYFRPMLLLPEEFSARPAAGAVLRHECIHLKRGDLFWKLLLLAAVCVHWYNPLMWIMREAVHQDLELACDEAVLEGRDAAERILYGSALLEHAKKPAARAGVFRGNA